MFANIIPENVLTYSEIRLKLVILIKLFILKSKSVKFSQGRGPSVLVWLDLGFCSWLRVMTLRIE